mgnify:CR=1 FL=1
MKTTITKTALMTCTVALAGVLAAPTAMAESTSDQIDREYNEAMRDEAASKRNDNSAANPDYSEDRKNIDSPKQVDKEYNKAMQQKRDAEGKAHEMKDEGGDYLEKRKNFDNPDNVQREYEKAIRQEKQ